MSRSAGATLTVDPSVDVLVVGGGIAQGWRAWSLRRDREVGFVLGPVFRSGPPWRPGVPARAACGRRSHAAPDRACRCGLHAAKDPSLLPAVRDGAVAVVGTVALWGRVIEHERGYRAALAYPSALRLVCSCCGRAGDASRMVVGPARRRGGSLVAVCRRHLRRPRRGTLPGRAVLLGLLSSYGVEPLSDGLARAIPRWRRLVVRRAFSSALGKALVVGYALLASVALLTTAAVLAGRLPGPAG